MTRTGIDNPWRPEGEPEPLNEWLEAGISVEEAKTWRNWRYHIAQAQAWRRAGVLGGIQAAQWSTAGVTPETVNSWRAVAIDASEAVNWHELGYSLEEAKKYKADGLSPAQAFDQRDDSGSSSRRLPGRRTGISHTVMLPSRAGRRAGQPELQKFVDAGVVPTVLGSYLARQWLDDTAVAWAKEGIDAAEAQLWKELGLRPAEAGRLVRKGATVAQTVRDWWGAGIPIDEVSEWIGAGLKPQEAAGQRARGISAEQAATLRALRDEHE